MVRLRQLLQKDIFAGQRGDHRHAQPAAKPPRHSAQQHGREMDHVGVDLVVEPAEQLFQFLALPAFLAAEHRDGQCAGVFRPGAGAAAARPAEQGRAVQQAVQPPGRVAEQSPTLLQMDVDAAEGDAILGDALLIGPQRRVERRQ